MVSILLAFAIEAGWGEWLERLEERDVLVGLRGEFVANQTQIRAVMATHRSRGEAYLWFRDARPEDVLALSSDSARTLYNRLWAPHTFDAARSSIDALIGAGELGLVRDGVLRAMLTHFLNLSDDLGEEAARVKDSAYAVLEGMIPHGGPWQGPPGLPGASSGLPDMSPADLTSVRRDNDLVGLISLSHQFSTVYLEELEVVSGVIDGILEQLDERGR